MNDKDLIAEARRHAEALIRGDEIGDADLLHDMATALEARQVEEAALAEVIDRAEKSTRTGSKPGRQRVIARAVIEFLGERHEPEPIDEAFTTLAAHDAEVAARTATILSQLFPDTEGDVGVKPAAVRKWLGFRAAEYRKAVQSDA